MFKIVHAQKYKIVLAFLSHSSSFIVLTLQSAENVNFVVANDIATVKKNFRKQWTFNSITLPKVHVLKTI